MRHHLVLGFATTSTTEQGKVLYIGTDRGKAVAVVNDPAGELPRRELYECAVPHIRRHLAKVPAAKGKGAGK